MTLNMRPVWVLMGNDYPQGVYDSEELVKEEIERREAKEPEEGRRVYWRGHMVPFVTREGK